MLYTHENVTLNIGNDVAEDMVGNCNFIIPFSHKDFVKDYCGFHKNTRFKNDNYESVFDHDYGSLYLNSNQDAYTSTDPDILISYISWCLEQNEKITIDVNYDSPFWGIHDFQHALFDSGGCTIYVSKEIESERLIDALDLMKSSGYTIEYDLFEEVKNAFKDRFGEELKVYEEDYLEYEYEEDES